MPTIRKRGNSYQLCYRKDGKEKRLSLKKLIEAEENKSELTFSKFAQQYIDWHAQEYPSSHERIAQIINQHLMPRFGIKSLEEITRLSLENYKHERLKVVKAGTVAKELRTIQALMNKAWEWDYIEGNRLKGVRAPKSLEDKPPSFYSLEDVKLIYTGSNSVHKEIWRLYFNTGMRASEGMNLRWENITENGIYILSTNNRRTKSGKHRIVPHNNGTRLALENLRNDGDYVLPIMHVKSLCRAFKKTVKRINLPGSIHWTRHTYASHLIMSGEPIRKVQYLLGHASVSTTEQYSHLAPGHISEIGITF